MGTVFIDRLDDRGESTVRVEVHGTLSADAHFALIGRTPHEYQRFFDAIKAALYDVGAQGASWTYGDDITSRWPPETGVAVLVVLADETSVRPEIDLTCHALFAQHPDLRGIGVLPPRAKHDAVLPSALKYLNATTDGDDKTDAVADILRVGGIDAEHRAVFISYSRADTVHANDLHAVLSSAGFDVFLDTHSIRPGARFAEVLDDAVVSTGMLVVIETVASLQSPWVKHEVEQAVGGPGGFAAIQPLPLAGGFSDIPDPFRHRSGDPNRWRSFVVSQHRSQLLRRRSEATASVMTALLANGHTATVIGPGCRCDNGPIGIEVRPPTVRQFRRLDDYDRRHWAALVAPWPVLGAGRDDQAWLSVVSQVRRYDIGLLSRMVNELTSIGGMP